MKQFILLTILGLFLSGCGENGQQVTELAPKDDKICHENRVCGVVYTNKNYWTWAEDHGVNTLLASTGQNLPIRQHSVNFGNRDYPGMLFRAPDNGVWSLDILTFDEKTREFFVKTIDHKNFNTPGCGEAKVINTNGSYTIENKCFLISLIKGFVPIQYSNSNNNQVSWSGFWDLIRINISSSIAVNNQPTSQIQMEPLGTERAVFGLRIFNKKSIDLVSQTPEEIVSGQLDTNQIEI